MAIYIFRNRARADRVCGLSADKLGTDHLVGPSEPWHKRTTVIQPPGTDQTLAPDVPLTPFVFQHAQLLADRPALVDAVTGNRLSYAQLAGAARLVAARLARNGFGRGDVCAIVAPNLPEYPVALHAAALLGGAALLVDPEQPLASLPDTLAAAPVVIAGPDALPAVRAAARGEVYVFGEAGGATPFSELYKSAGYVPDVRIDCQVDVVLYCSNASGLVRLTHQLMIRAICRLEAAQPIAEGEVVVSTVPFWHAHGVTAILGLGLYRGATLVILPRSTQPAALLDAVGRHGATSAYLESWDEQLAGTCAERLGCTVRAADRGRGP